MLHLYFHAPNPTPDARKPKPPNPPPTPIHTLPQSHNPTTPDPVSGSCLHTTPPNIAEKIPQRIHC
ncbi:uncharacterized protein CC84DRAFT_1166455 [Paraphaeosphaeria sporulosa]|uniref:Uncharacterized protein n=1 Tax=Paraphaeosphaeria sporulosa TaxID=1460663 RepID=A0A177C6X5_9PLEO|nr:uncharacterized protein CC84DRAFT_1166455 [Paraphaeosphaeria sporulosa]OAG02622.1 hypothetical protein CC84DRAFT_1166455 [Paraphaeosphaeria sporulosa]